MSTTPRVTPFLMFQGCAEEAMRFYTETFPDSQIRSIDRYGPEGPGPEGSVRQARFVVMGLDLMCIDSPAPHDFTFTPSWSLFVTCDDRARFDRFADALGEGGKFLMPPDDYGFSARFAWVQDRFGVSWQLNLP